MRHRIGHASSLVEETDCGADADGGGFRSKSNWASRVACWRLTPQQRAFCRREAGPPCWADLVVLPYREIDQSGVLFTALAFGKPLLLSDVGGFPEIAATGAARTVPAGDAAALHEALRELLGNPDALAALTARAREVAQGKYGWDAIARQTLDLYGSLLSENPPR